MKESRFLEIINSLSTIDIENLKFYIDSKLFNKNKNVNLLYSLVHSFPSDRKLNKAVLFEQFNALKKISHPNFRMVLTGFSNVIETYIIHKKINEDKLKAQQYLMKYSYDNNLQFLLKKTDEKINSYLRNKIDLNLNEKFIKTEYLLLKYLISGKKQVLNKADGSLENLRKEYSLRRINFEDEKYITEAKKIINEFSESKLQKSDLFLCYYYLLHKIKSGDVSKIKELEKIFKIAESVEIKNLISEFIIDSENINAQEQLNYVIWYWANSSIQNKAAHADKLLFISLHNFEIELSKKIIKFLSPETGYFSRALYYFYFNDFTHCLTELEKIPAKDKELEAKIRQLKMCSYLRLNQLKQFTNAYHAFKKFAVKNKKLTQVKEAQKFCQILFQIVNNKDNIGKLLKLKNSIAATEITNKTWLENELEFHFKRIA